MCSNVLMNTYGDLKKETLKEQESDNEELTATTQNRVTLDSTWS
jgi:hypothetical protein